MVDDGACIGLNKPRPTTSVVPLLGLHFHRLAMFFLHSVIIRQIYECNIPWYHGIKEVAFRRQYVVACPSSPWVFATSRPERLQSVS